MKTLTLLVLGAAVWLGGCAADGPVIPPAELKPVKKIVTARQQWSTSIGKQKKRGAGTLGPVVLDDHVYAASADGSVRSVDVESGKTLWAIELNITLTSGVAGDESAVYVADRDGTIFALDRKDGSTLWQYKMSSEVLAPVAAGFGYLIARSADGRVVGLQTSDGSERWSNTYNPPALTVHGYSRPVLLPDGVLLGLDDGKVLALVLKSGETVWQSELSFPSGRSEIERLVDIDADILVDDQFIYAVNYQGKLARIEPARGQQTWSVELSSIAGMAQSEEVLFVTAVGDQVLAIAKKTGDTLWEQTALTGRKLSQPAKLDNAVAVADLDGYIHLLSIDDGSIIGRIRAGKKPIVAPPLVVDGGLIVQSIDARLRKIVTGK